jgi:3-dehydroquinate synthase
LAGEIVHVDLGERGYDITVDSGNLPALGCLVRALEPATHAVVVTDRNVLAPHGRIAVDSLQATGMRVDLLTVEAGEGAKSIAVAESLWSQLAALKADRKSLVVAVGGGVIGDLAGFVAATYARGLRFVQVPTTLLAQVDSSVGGKVGVNLPSAKNMVGAFWQPQAVLIDTAVLNTLPEREYRAGLAEVVKYGVILDAPFFEYLEANIDAVNRREACVLRHIVARSCRLKADIVEQDEREETGVRAILNYGHTFAHAFETVTSYGTLLHGEAVSIGMMCAARLAASLGKIPTTLVERQQSLLEAMHLPVRTPSVSPQAMVEAMQRDKKVEHGRLRFVLPTRLGRMELVGDITPDEALAALGS